MRKTAYLKLGLTMLTLMIAPVVNAGLTVKEFKGVLRDNPGAVPVYIAGMQAGMITANQAATDKVFCYNKDLPVTAGDHMRMLDKKIKSGLADDIKVEDLILMNLMKIYRCSSNS